ncbi:Phenazine biosynthesis-like domain-containing protein [Vanrija pseudolonga]|uniref:Phenazine biosynthesis-like domain-containing protein n=1 Tax=Vanrija pseudolonga TaxID=143232 RepID=A0AAF1BFI3_9TREE|nr:Phenazine biosynthesis-like domain-containing protein [Vanrija pseudolonga]
MPAPSLPYHLVNAFVSPTTPHSGNQAAVVIYPNDTDERINDTFFRLTAHDFHFSETAFLVPIAGEPTEPRYRIRFWTPAVEVPLCGHATLASAYTTLYAVHPDAEAIVFDTHHGLVRCVRSDTGGVVLDMPAHVAAQPDEGTDKALRATMLAAAPSLSPGDLLRVGRLTDFGDGDRVVYELAASVDLEKLPVNLEQFNSAATGQAIVTQLVGADSAGLKINSRIFCPYWGVPEDPVTGAAHTVLGPYYLAGLGARHASTLLAGDLPSATITARQVSQRGGGMRVSLSADGTRVLLNGQAARWGDGLLHAV